MVLLAQLSLGLDAYSQHQTVAAGNWDNAANWSPAFVPNGNGTITINHEMSINANRTFSTWSGSHTFIVTENGGITVNGNLTLQGQSMRFTLDGGTLTVSGELIVQNTDARFTFEDGNLSVGTLRANSGSTVTFQSNTNANVGTLIVGNNSSARFVNYGNVNVSGNSNFSGPFKNYGTIEMNNLTGGGSSSSILENFGQMVIKGDVSLPSSTKFYSIEGSSAIVEGSLTLASNLNLTVGTNNSSPPFADLLIMENLISQNSGDILVNQNGRIAVYGNVTSGGGGTFLQIENGGQMYVGGDFDFSTGTGNSINNKNTEEGFMGLYMDGTVTFNSGEGFVGGQGQGTQAANNSGYNDTADLENENPEFLQWLSSLPNTTFSTTPLPVSLLYFKAIAQERSVLLLWETTTEKNNDFFTIERSINGTDFETLVRISGNGTKNENSSYEFEDLNPNAGLNYYRLKQTDFDGTQEIFKIIVAQIRIPALNLIKIYPNPAIDFISIESTINISLMEVYNSNGKIVFEVHQPGNQKHGISHLDPGVYIVRTYTGERIFSQKLIKQ